MEHHKNVSVTPEEKDTDIYVLLYMFLAPFCFIISYTLFREFYIIRKIPSPICYFLLSTLVTPYLINKAISKLCKMRNKHISDTTFGMIFLSNTKKAPARWALFFSDFWFRYLMLSWVLLFITALFGNSTYFIPIKKTNGWFAIALVLCVIIAIIPSFVKTSKTKKIIKNTLERNQTYKQKKNIYKGLLFISIYPTIGISMEITSAYGSYNNSFTLLVSLFCLPLLFSFFAMRIWQIEENHLQYLKESKND